MQTLLIANRGEIAIRIARTARQMGIRTIGVYSDADADAPHVHAVDQAVRIGPAAASASYLNIEAIIDAAKQTGADAIHPGYGFLSERAEFVRAVEVAGLIFVGPSAEVMDQLGRKDHARVVALAAGVPVVPGFTVDHPPLPADYPVLVKVAAGGGGKGIRIVEKPTDLDEAIAAAKREAAKAFGDDTILIETYVSKGRHVEVQVFGDHDGKVVHFFEYGMLGFLCAHATSRTWPRRPRPRMLALGAFLASAFGLSDELHQAFVPGRTAELLDFVADVLGASCGAFARGLLGRLAMRLRPSKEPSS